MGTGGPRIDLGSRVRLHISIALEDGSEAISTFGEEPLELRVGDGTLLQTLELALIGLAAGDTETLEVDPEHAFGAHDPSRIQTVDRTRFPADVVPVPGTVVGFTGPGGEEVAGTVLAVEGGTVRVDFNHPLAGHRIRYRVQILEVEAPSPQEGDAGD